MIEIKTNPVVTQAHLDQYKIDLEGIVNRILGHSKKIKVKSDSRIEIMDAFSKNINAKGLYVWYTTCKPKDFVNFWNKRLEIYQKYKIKNAESPNPVKTKLGEPINFLLPKVNPYWERNLTYKMNENSITPLYVGKAENEMLKNRLLSHYNGSIQTSALKLFGSTMEDQRKNSIISEFIVEEQKLLKEISFKNTHCKVIIIEDNQKDRLLTYERILREVLEPLIGEK